MNNSQLNVLSIFNIIHLSEDLIKDYLSTQSKLANEGISLHIPYSDNNLIVDNFKKEMKGSIAMVDDIIYNELIEYKYHIHYNSLIYFEIRSAFDNKKIWSETKTFDDHISFFKNFNDIDEILNHNCELIIFIKIIKIDKKHDAFNQMLNDKRITTNYLAPILKEVLRALKLVHYYKTPNTERDSELDFIIKNNHSEFVKTNIELFKNTLNLVYLLKLCSHNFWANSNF